MALHWWYDHRLEDKKSKAAPALAEFDGVAHMVHLGISSNDIYHSWFDGFRWTENVAIFGQSSKATPALAKFGDRLHMVHLGDSSNDIWHT